MYLSLSRLPVCLGVSGPLLPLTGTRAATHARGARGPSHGVVRTSATIVARETRRGEESGVRSHHSASAVRLSRCCVIACRKAVFSIGRSRCENFCEYLRCEQAV